MREIKFRVPHYRTDTGLFDHFSYWGRGINGSEFCSPSVTNFTVALDDEQFTGLKDKTGVEIYEGDIVHGKSWKEPHAMRTSKIAIGWVDFSPTHGFFFNTNNLDGSYRSLPAGCRTFPNLTRCEIIGNIHETPELLDK